MKYFLNENKPPNTTFEKEILAAPSQYHLKSIQDTVKDWLITYQLQSYFSRKKLKEFHVFSSLGDSLAAVDNDHNLPTVEELVNHKHSKY